ncbi:hypothetical protein Tco_0014532 [Tanacetum coccineum]
MFDKFFNPPSVCLPEPEVAAALRLVPQTGSSSPNTSDQDPPQASNSSSQVQDQSPTISQGVAEQLQNTHLDHPVPEQVHNQRDLPRDFLLDSIESLEDSLVQARNSCQGELPFKGSVPDHSKRMSMLVQSSQCHKKAKQSQDDDLRFDLADDLKEAQDRKFIMQERASSRSCSLQFITR